MSQNKPTDVQVKAARLYFLPVQMRIPLKFGHEVVNAATCARVCLTVADGKDRRAEGWGETPLSVQWVWPSRFSLQRRLELLKEFCQLLAREWSGFPAFGHPMELGHQFQEQVLPGLWKTFIRAHSTDEPMPWLAALVCCSLFDLALHDAFGVLHQVPTYQTYTSQFMTRDLTWFFASEKGEAQKFRNKFPSDFLVKTPLHRLRAWHLVGGLDLLDKSEFTGSEPNDGYPVLLPDWIERDGLKCLKIKLRGNDSDWDYQRIVRIAEIGISHGVEWLTTDFNCTVSQPEYVNDLLDRLRDEFPRIHGMILYVEQPFPYELEEHRIDVHSVSARKPLFLDESAHDWRMVKLGSELGWSGVALKTCKTQTGALLSACWAKTHGMTLMVQDLTNPMLAQITHLLLASHVGTIMGVETNSMQFSPDASTAEETVHPGLYRRRDGVVDLATIGGAGFGYRLGEIKRELPEPAIVTGS
jgi:L-alanine-DL-glutamate epimerase-like enolase superfamily enzyme